jgi:siderophore synthetase component
MKREKTVSELRQEIMASAVLREKSQDEISRAVRVNQATLSRVVRGQFKRRSKAVASVCEYASISCITSQPVPELSASLDQLSGLARRSPNARHALKLIRLAAELLETDLPAATR